MQHQPAAQEVAAAGVAAAAAQGVEVAVAVEAGVAALSKLWAQCRAQDIDRGA